MLPIFLVHCVRGTLWTLAQMSIRPLRHWGTNFVLFFILFALLCVYLTRRGNPACHSVFFSIAHMLDRSIRGGDPLGYLRGHLAISHFQVRLCVFSCSPWPMTPNGTSFSGLAPGVPQLVPLLFFSPLFSFIPFLSFVMSQCCAAYQTQRL